MWCSTLQKKEKEKNPLNEIGGMFPRIVSDNNFFEGGRGWWGTEVVFDGTFLLYSRDLSSERKNGREI